MDISEDRNPILLGKNLKTLATKKNNELWCIQIFLSIIIVEKLFSKS